MSTLRIVTLCASAVLAVVLGSCDGAGQFDRTNPNDPESEDFVPRPASDLTATSKSDGTVLLRWAEASEFADGHLVEKSLGDSTSFQTLASVAGSLSVYRDGSQNFAMPTYYRVRPFERTESGRNFSGTQQASLSFGSVEMLRIDTDLDGTFRLSWADESQLEAGFRVEVSVDGAPFREVATLERNQTSYSYRPEALSFADTVRAYRVTAPLLGEDSASIGRSSQRFKVRERFAPRNVSVAFPDEATAEVSWANPAGFADHLELVHLAENQDEDTTITLSPQTERHVFNGLLDFGGHRYRVTAVDEEGDRSKTAEKWKEFEIEPPSLTIASKADPPDGVNLSWSHPAPDRVTGYTVTRSGVQSDEQTRVDIPADTRSYVDADVGTETVYSYVVRTRTSPTSETRMAIHSPDYQRVYTMGEVCGSKFYGSSVPPRTLAVRPDGAVLAVAVGGVGLIDARTGDVLECIASGSGASNVSYSPDGSLLGIGAPSEQSHALLWSRESEAVVQRLRFPVEYVYPTSTAFGPEGQLFSAVGSKGRIAVWKTSTGERMWATSNQIQSPYAGSWAVSFDASGETVATGTTHGGLHRVVLRDSRSGAVQKTLSLNTGVGELRFAQTDEGEVLLVSTVDRETLVLDPTDGTRLATVPGESVAVSENGNRMVTNTWYLGYDEQVGQLLWSLPEGTPIGGVLDETSRSSALALSPQGDELFVRSREGIIRWAPVTGTERWRSVY